MQPFNQPASRTLTRFIFLLNQLQLHHTQRVRCERNEVYTISSRVQASYLFHSLFQTVRNLTFLLITFGVCRDQRGKEDSTYLYCVRRELYTVKKVLGSDMLGIPLRSVPRGVCRTSGLPLNLFYFSVINLSDSYSN